MVKNLPANAGDAGDAVSIQYSCLGNPMDRGSWWATVHRATQSPPQMSTPLNSDEIIEVSKVKL